MAHPFARLLDNLEIIGPVPDTDPTYGRAYRTVDMLAGLVDDIADEVHFDTVETSADGTVHLVAAGRRVARVLLSSHHADAHLVVADPQE